MQVMAHDSRTGLFYKEPLRDILPLDVSKGTKVEQLVFEIYQRCPFDGVTFAPSL
jgi:hypothetical protein